MAVRLASPAILPKAWRRVPGRRPVGGFASRLIGLEGRLQWRRRKTIQASCQTGATEKYYELQQVEKEQVPPANAKPHPKFAIRSILVRRTRIEQGFHS